MDRDIRLYVTLQLEAGVVIDLSRPQAHYLMNVMRCKVGERVLIFNGADGEWRAEIVSVAKAVVQVVIKDRLREQQKDLDIWLCFAPVKNVPLNNLVQKATELGVSVLQPVITERTIVRKVNKQKIEANVIEAAEQCGRLSVPEVREAVSLKELQSSWRQEVPLIVCDESGGGKSIMSVLPKKFSSDFAVLVGPEGGFTKDEFALLRQSSYVRLVALGPRILRADTAAIAVLACCQSVMGDWDCLPNFK